MTSLLRLTPNELDETLAALDAPLYRADQVLQALYRRGFDSLDAMTQLPGDLRERMREAGLTLDAPALLREVASDDGETTKALLALPGGSTVETVLMQYPRPGRTPRSTVCISTQAGCAMGCVFCATGQMGFERKHPRRGHRRPGPPLPAPPRPTRAARHQRCLHGYGRTPRQLH